MAPLQSVIEDRAAELVAEATDRPVTPAALDIPDDGNEALGKKPAKVAS